MSQLRGSQNYVWNVTDVLGQGATGSVYKCRHKVAGCKMLFFQHSYLTTP